MKATPAQAGADGDAATVQGNHAGIWVGNVAVTPASSYFRIYINKVPTKNLPVGWFVIT